MSQLQTVGCGLCLITLYTCIRDRGLCQLSARMFLFNSSLNWFPGVLDVRGMFAAEVLRKVDICGEADQGMLHKSSF